MGADFNAGSIEGTLDLDTDPFVRGLEEARARAAAFEQNSIKSKATVDTDVDRSKMEGVQGDAKLGLDDAEFRAKMAEDKAKVDLFGRKRASAKVSVDNSQASAALAALSRNIDKLGGAYKKASPGMPGSGHGLAWLIGMAAALAPAFGPASAAVGLFGAAGIAAFGGAAVSLGLYAKVLGGTIKQIQEANKAGKELPGWLGKAQKAMKGMSDAWGDLQKKTAAGQGKLLTQVFTVLAGVIPKLIPLINSISKGLSGAFEPITHLMQSGLFDRFIKLLSSNAVKDLPQIGHALSNGLRGLMNLFIALDPIIQRLVQWLPQITGQFARWSRVKAPDFIDKVFGTIQKYGPQTLQMLSSLGDFIVNIGRALAPLTGPALDVITHLADSLAKIDFTPLTAGIGAVMKHLAPFADVIGTLVNTLLPPLGTILETIGNDFIGPLGDSLAERLNPALQTLGDVLDFIAPYLGDVINSFADLVNPTGVAFFTKLIQSLAPVVKDIVPPLSRLAIAIESMVDAGLETITPVLGPLAAGLDTLVKGLTPVVDALSWFLSHKAVADTIIGVALAIKAITITSATVSALTGLVGAIRTIAALSAAEGVLAGVAAVSPAAAAGMSAFGLALDFVLGPIGLIILAVAALGIAAYLIYKHWDKIGPWLKGMWEGIKHTFSAAVGWIGGKLSDLGHTISSKFQSVLSWVKSHWVILAIIIAPFLAMPLLIARHWGTVQAFLKTIPGKVKGVFSSAASWLLHAGHDIIAGLASGVQSRWDSLKSFMSGIGGKISSAVGNLGGLLTSAGWNIIQGLYNGIKSAISKLNPAGLVHSVVGAISGLGPHSPAKWGPFSGSGWSRWTDGGIIKGLAAGIRKATPQAVGAVADGMEQIQAVVNGRGARLSIPGQPAGDSASLSDVTNSIQRLQDALATLLEAQNGVIRDSAEANARKIADSDAATTHRIITKVRATV
jgi:phage-related protein